MKRADILIVTAVWGQWHLDVFLDVNLPTLLAPGNMPALAKRHEIAYQLHVRSSEVARITDAETFRRLAALVPVDLRIIRDERQLDDPIAAHTDFWRSAIEEARRAGQFALLMPPDVLWSDGSLAHVADLLDQGKLALFTALPRVASNSFLPAFHAQFGRSPDRVAMSGRDLMALCFDHLHPLMAAHARSSEYFPTHAEMVVWPIEKEGLAVRLFGRELFVFDPARVRLNHLQLVADPVPWSSLHTITDSDLLFAVSLAPLGKDIGWYCARRRVRSLDIARWSLMFDSPANDYIAGARIRWHAAAITESAWRAREISGDLLSRRVALERATLRVISHMGRDPVSRTAESARLLALSLLDGRLTRALRGLPHQRGYTTVVFLPDDAALAEAWPSGWRELFVVPGGGLERVFRDHVAVGPASLDLDRLASGQSLDLTFLSGRCRGLHRHEGAWAIDDIVVSRVERVSDDLALCYTRGVLCSDRGSVGQGMKVS